MPIKTKENQQKLWHHVLADFDKFGLKINELSPLRVLQLLKKSLTLSHVPLVVDF